MSSTRLHRYDFGSLRDFRGPLVATILPDENEEIVVYEPPPPPTFNEEELIAARAAGHRLGHSEGFEAGMARAAEQADAQRIAVETTIMHMSHLLSALQQGYQQMLDGESASLTQLVHLIARKIAGEALAANAVETIKALVAQCMPVVLSKPRLNVELNPNLFDQTVDQIESMLQTTGFEGEIQFRTNPAIGISDVVLDWGTGQASRNTEQLWQEIETLLAAMPLASAPLNVAYEVPPEPTAANNIIMLTDAEPSAVEEPPITPTV